MHNLIFLFLSTFACQQWADSGVLFERERTEVVPVKSEVYYIGEGCNREEIVYLDARYWWEYRMYWLHVACGDMAWIAATVDGRCLVFSSWCSDLRPEDPLLSTDEETQDICDAIVHNGSDVPSCPAPSWE